MSCTALSSSAPWLFIKLCWLMSTYAVSADRALNIDETSCRFLSVHQIGWGRRGVKQAQLQGNTEEATTFTVAFSMDPGPLDMLAQIVRSGKTDGFGTEHTHHVTSETGWATTTMMLPLPSALDEVLNASREGQAWIFLWDMASIRASEATVAALNEGCSPSCLALRHPTTKHVVFAARRRGSLRPPSQPVPSSTAHSKRTGPGGDKLGPNGRRVPQRRQLRAQGDVKFRDAMTEAAALHAHGELFTKPCDVAVFRSFKSCIQAQASATLARSVIDGSFEGLARNKAWRRQSSADWAARAVKDLCAENQGVDDWMASLACPQRCPLQRSRRRRPAALHAHDELFSRHIEPEPAPEDPVEWAMAEASDDEDDAPMPDAPPEPELIDITPAPPSAPPMSNLERCIALRLVYGAGPR